MQCPDCQLFITPGTRRCICGWVKPKQQEEPPRPDHARARSALADVARMTYKHLRVGLTREQIIANWRFARKNAPSQAIRDMAEEALRNLGEKEREPGQDDEEHPQAQV